MGCIHGWLYVKCTLRCVGSRGCTLSILSDVLVAIMMVVCAQSVQCINAAGSKTLSCSVSPLQDGNNSI